MSTQLEQLAALTAAQKKTADNLAALTQAISARETPVDLSPVIAAEQALAAQIAALTTQLTPVPDVTPAAAPAGA